MTKKLMVWVLPGVALTLANPRWPNNRLRSDDFPTFDRPAKAISGHPDRGNSLGREHEQANVAS
jgi:hypothetical protein